MSRRLQSGRGRARAWPRLILVACAWASIGLEHAAAQTLDDGIARLRSSDAFDRHRGEVLIRSLGTDALPEIARQSEGEDRILRFRMGRIFSDLCDKLLAELDQERQSLLLDRNELRSLRERMELTSIEKTAMPSLDEWKKKDPEIEKKIGEILVLERLGERHDRFEKGFGPPLEPSDREHLERLQKLMAGWRAADPGFEEAVRPLVRLAKLQSSGLEGRELNEIEQMRMKELDDRVTERAPRVDKLVKRLDDVGTPGWNCLLARVAGARRHVAAYYDEMVKASIEKLGPDALPADPAAFERTRYGRGLLWAWEVERKGTRTQEVAAALDRHLAATIRDLDDPETIVRERAADEIYLLGERGLSALRARMESGGKEVAERHRFLLGLLRWRIRPRTYARVGIDFEDYDGLAFRDRRRKIFAFASAAGEDAITTLRAIVADDALEPSFFVKLAAAKALAGLRDMSGFNHLILTHPDMTLKRPEVSRELLIVQGFEYIRENDYQKAVEEFRKLLEEFPFDFRANYHIAFAYLLLKNYPKSIHYFEIARRINPKDQFTLYNLACAYALSGKKDQALDVLEAAMEAGFDDVKHINEDPDLESLRDDPRYRQLLERMGTTE
jgi:tetratricopeptide (TPR) repeat protein